MSVASDTARSVIQRMLQASDVTQVSFLGRVVAACRPIRVTKQEAFTALESLIASGDVETRGHYYGWVTGTKPAPRKRGRASKHKGGCAE